MSYRCYELAPEKCRSFNFDKQTSECDLLYVDGKTTLRPSVRAGVDLYDLHCLAGEIFCSRHHWPSIKEIKFLPHISPSVIQSSAVATFHFFFLFKSVIFIRLSISDECNLNLKCGWLESGEEEEAIFLSSQRTFPACFDFVSAIFVIIQLFFKKKNFFFPQCKFVFPDSKDCSPNKDGAVYSRYLYSKQGGIPSAQHQTVALSKCLDLCANAQR